MTKFRKKADTKVENYMGGVSFKHPPKEELAFAVLTSFIEDSYYASKDKRVDRISGLVKDIAKTDPLFIAKLAVYTRTIFNMRSSSHVLFGELARSHRGDDIVRRALMKGIVRVDDAAEIIAYLGKPIPNQVKKGVAQALTKFDAYQLGKYRGAKKDYSLVDIINLVHPSTESMAQEVEVKLDEYWEHISEEKKQQLNKSQMPSSLKINPIEALVWDLLRNKETWESRLSSGEKKEQVWKDLIDSGKIGYMALLRNLRNIVKTCNPDTIAKAAEMISDEKKVLRSKQLPFRFLSAYAELEKYKGEGGREELEFEDEVVSFEKLSKQIDKLLEAVEKAALYSVKNIPLLEGRTLILTDNSGSMRGDYGGGSAISAMSSRKTSDIANLFAVLYWTRAESTLVGLFGDRLITPKLDRAKGIFENYKTIEEEAEKCGGATETGIFTAIEKLIKEKKKVDRIVIFSDCQIGTGCGWYDTSGRKHGSDFNKLYQQYAKMFPGVKTYSIDLRGYGDFSLQGNTCKLAGWHSEIFNVMNLLESDKKALINEIEKIEI